MDNQMKRGILDVCVLAALLREESYGYKIIKDIKPFVQISESTLYPILRRLESAGAVSVHSAEHNGRLRKYYAITDNGIERVKAFRGEWSELKKMYDFVERELDANG